MSMIVKEVSSKLDIQAFLNLPIKIYKNNPHWVQPLDKDIEAVFDKDSNRAFKNGICKRWLLYNDTKEVIGRVATFVNKRSEEHTSELQSRPHLVCRLLLEKKKNNK